MSGVPDSDVNTVTLQDKGLFMMVNHPGGSRTCLAVNYGTLQ